MNIVKNYNEKELTLSVDGRIDTITSQELDNEINEELGNFDSLIVDFTDLEYISSTGLRVLIATQKKLKKSDISFCAFRRKCLYFSYFFCKFFF